MKFSKIIFAAIFGIIFTVANSEETEVSSFTFGKCAAFTPVATYNPVTSLIDCQSRCKSNTRCTFFILSKKESICYVVEGSIQDYIDECKLIAGPGHINFQDWLDDVDPCKVRPLPYNNRIEHTEGVRLYVGIVKQFQF